MLRSATPLLGVKDFACRPLAEAFLKVAGSLALYRKFMNNSG